MCLTGTLKAKNEACPHLQPAEKMYRKMMGNLIYDTSDILMFAKVNGGDLSVCPWKESAKKAGQCVWPHLHVSFKCNLNPEKYMLKQQSVR